MRVIILRELILFSFPNLMQKLENLIAAERKARAQSNAMRQAYANETDPKTATKLLHKRVELADQTSKAVDAIALHAIGRPAYTTQKVLPKQIFTTNIYPSYPFTYAYN